MQLTIIEANDETMTLAYAVARIVYAETLATSLRVVEALTSMIANASRAREESVAKIISDASLFESINAESSQHKYIDVDTARKDFQMCLRVALRMLHGNLPDMCHGATHFHRSELLPGWAMARGYIADIDGILFYV